MANLSPLLLSARDAASALSISERLLWGLTSPRGEIPVVKIGRSIRYDVNDLRRWIDAKKSEGLA